MKYTILVLFTVVVSCNTKSVETKTKNKSESLSEKIVTWEEDEKEMKSGLIKKRQDFILTMQKKKFSFSCFDKCEDGGGVSREDLRKYVKRKPINIKKKVINDTINIKFKFISDCCLEYIGDVDKNGDTLRLSFKNISYKPCDCYCYYEYCLPIDKYDYKFIYLGDSLISKNKMKR